MASAALHSVGGLDLEERAGQVAVLAFRCARKVSEKREVACAEALKAYLAVCPHKTNASDQVVAAIVDAVRARPHWA
jgi:hypothetical protein